MDAKIKELLTRLSFFAEDGMGEPKLVEFAKQADALLLEVARKPNTQQPVAWVWQFPDGWRYEDPFGTKSECEQNCAGYDGQAIPLYTAPPVPRDVLMAFGTSVHDAAINAAGDNKNPSPLYGVMNIDLAAIADRYASKVQPEPVSQQLLAALKMVLDDTDALDGRPRTYECVMEAIAAAEAAQPVVRHSDDAAVDRFAAAMKHKLEIAREKGRSGWDDQAKCSVEFLAELLCGHLGKGNAGTFEDVANFAMMLHQRGAEPSVLQEAAYQFWKDHRFTAAERHAVEQALAQQSASAQPVAVPAILEDIAYLADGARVARSEGNFGDESEWLRKLYDRVGELDWTLTKVQLVAVPKIDESSD